MKPTVIADWNKLGAVVRATRLEKSWSQHELAERAHVSRAWLAKVERGHRGAALEQVLLVFRALGLTLVAEAGREEPSRARADELASHVQSSVERRRDAWRAAAPGPQNVDGSLTDGGRE